MGSSPYRRYSILGVAHPLWDNILVQGVHRWTTLSRGRDCEEGRHVALINHFCKKCLEQTSSSMYLCKRIVIKLILDYCQYSRVCNNGKRVVFELLQTVLSVIFAYFQLKYG